ncbi:hypothetical protein [Moorena sp. SIO3F7]|uniref:hypothetical protein n=1 Tax=Moorena sp. SIO3F7 TaxID=2607839 RepID=UPI001417CE64|nr:hypothetical protein [Moorena sp. SIO3F7]NEO15857.1 hypothetical protein [Moorena sp. SIO3E8]
MTNSIISLTGCGVTGASHFYCLTRWVELASWWNGHLARFISGQAVPTLATRRKISASPWVVRYGAGCPNSGYEVEHEGKPAPNAPYATKNSYIISCLLPLASCLLPY